MTHASATWMQVLALMENVDVTIIPALVLLDGEGVLICKEGQEHLRADPTGEGFPWPSQNSNLRPPQGGFELKTHSTPEVPWRFRHTW